MSVPESRELRDEAFWRAGGGFRWCWPKIDVLHPADRSFLIGLNRYPHNVIGAYVSWRGRGVGVRWKHTPRRRAWSMRQERRARKATR